MLGAMDTSTVVTLLVVLVVGLAFVAGWSAFGRIRDTRLAAGPGPSGVPTTRDASYDPARRS